MEKLCIDLTCPNLPFVEHSLVGYFFSMERLKTGKALTLLL